MPEPLPRRIVQALAPYVSEARQARLRAVIEARSRSVTLVLEEVVNDHNGAAILRTADAFGLMEVHVIPGPAGFKVSRKVAQGSQKWLDAHRHESVDVCYDDLRERGFEIWASAVHGEARPLEQLPMDRPLALVFGNEHDGVSPEAIAAADGRFHVPMYGFVESLNVSVAAALSLAEVTRARRKGGHWTPLGEEEKEELLARWFTQSVRAAEPLLAREGLSPLASGVGSHARPSKDAAFEMVEDDRP